MTLWNRIGLTEILGQPSGTIVAPPASPWGSGRTVLRWSCNGNGAAIEATENPDMSSMSLAVSCEDAEHRELEDYCTLRVDDIVLLDPRKTATQILRANVPGYQLSIAVSGPPSFSQGMQLRLRAKRRDNSTFDVRNVGTYMGGSVFYEPAIFVTEPGELHLTLHAIRNDIINANPNAHGIVLWAGSLQVH